MRALLLIFVAFLLSACGPVANQAVVKQSNIEQNKVEVVPASIPITFEGFSSYIDGASDLGTFEGIWESSGDPGVEYTVGIYRDKRDARYPYKAFIIDANNSWSPGEIKIKFTKLDSSGLALSQYYMGDKSELRATWEVYGNGAIRAIAPNALAIVGSSFIKIYPRKEAEQRASGSGSGWHIGGGYIVTNAHVVSGANEITVTVSDRILDARVVIMDQKLDLSILKLSEVPSGLGVVPVSSDFSAGQRVYAVGFPLGKVLGRTPKITDGLISSLEGLNSDPTTLTISAPIQPGSSGGPLLDEMGNAVGIVVAKLRDAASPDGDTENVNYAVNVKYLLPLIDGLPIDKQIASTTKAGNICDLRCSSVVYIETK